MFIKPKNIDMIKKLYEYELCKEYVFGEDSEEETSPPRKYYFKKETADEHNRQYALNNIPRKLVKVKKGKVIEKPEWWSGTQDTLRQIVENNNTNKENK